MADRSGVSPLVPSDEGDEKGLALGKAQGDALSRTLEHMIGDVAHDGREIRSGEYLVAYAVEKAEGMYVPRDGRLEWSEPGEANAHVEVAVRDAADGRLIPGLEVRATLIGPDGADLGTKRLPLLWHPYLYHYGANWKVPGSGRYGMRVSFGAPTFSRHDKKNGHRFVEGAEVTFDDVAVAAGQD